MELEIEIEENTTNEYEIDYNLSNTNESYSIYQISFIIVAYILVFILSVLGNSIILIIIYLKKSKRTVNNYFLVSMTISNILYTIVAPFPFLVEISENKGQWMFSDWMCPTIHFINKLAINLNTLTMTASLVERLISITCPFKTKLSKNNCFIIIFLIWLLSVSFALPWAVLMKIQVDNFDQNQSNSVKVCLPSGSFVDVIRIYFFILNIVQYILPVLALIVTYSIVTYYVRYTNKKTIQIDVNETNGALRRKNEKKLFKMQLLMIVCFNVFWLPFQLNTIFFAFNPVIYQNLMSPLAAKFSWMISHWFAFCHFSITPCISVLSNDGFRKDIIDLILRRKKTNIKPLNKSNISFRYRKSSLDPNSVKLRMHRSRSSFQSYSSGRKMSTKIAYNKNERLSLDIIV